MKHEIYLGGKAFAYDGVLPCVYCVIGQRNIETERVDVPPPSNEDAELLDRRRKFVYNEIGGRYSLRPLEWAESIEEAEMLVARFCAEDWINVKIVPVDSVIENA
jgi:hypothetical protein